MKIIADVGVVPCRDCQERQMGCHSTCEKYKTWRKAKDKKHKEELEKKRCDIEYECYVKSRQRSIRNKKILSEKEKRKIFRNI